MSDHIQINSWRGKWIHIQTEIYCSSYLIAAGMRLKSFHRTNGITTFEFDNSEKLQQLVNNYYSMSATVNVTAYGWFCYKKS